MLFSCGSSGDYEPPIGSAVWFLTRRGPVDRALRAGELLATVAGHIELRYRRAERAKIAGRASNPNL